MSTNALRNIGRAATAVSAGVIAYATLTPDVSARGIPETLGHFLLFLPLGFGAALWLAALPQDRRRRASLLVAVAVLAFAAATEVAQGFITTRHPSLTDWFADAAGAAAGLLLGGALIRLAARRRD